jgi:4-diphosphocytidyl-2-C-methyl-D-erythritol kinase
MVSVLREFAPAKINLALHVLGRRADGFHDLDSAVAFADVGDVLAITPALITTIEVDGPFAGDVPTTGDNLVLKAHAALSGVATIGPVAFRLTKNLPVASGIGGGSADAAAALRGLLRLHTLSLAPSDVQRVALSLGADVPVCLHGKACRMQGVGDVISPLPRLPAPTLVLVNPLKPCGTAAVFKAMGLVPGSRAGSALDCTDPAQWRNDMTTAAVQVLPVIRDVLAALEQAAPRCAVRMSGSGATCFALCSTEAEAQAVAQRIGSAQPGWWVAAARLT